MLDNIFVFVILGAVAVYIIATIIQKVRNNRRGR